MAIDFSDLRATPVHQGHIDFSDLNAVPVVGDYNEEGDTTAFGAAGRGAAGMIPLGEQAYSGIASLASHKPYIEERKNLEELVKKDIEQHPEARIAGQVAGVAAPIVATAGLAAPESLLGAAGQGALFGAAGGAGRAIDTLASGGSKEQAIGDVALGTGVGALGGAAGQGIGKILGKATSTLLPSSEDLGAHSVASILGGTTRQVRSLPCKNPNVTLNEMGSIMRKTAIDGKPLIEAMDQYPARLEKFVKLERGSGKTIGDLIETAKVEPMDAKPLEQALTSSMNVASPEEKAHMQSVIEHLKTYAPDGKIPFTALQKLKTEVGDKAYQGQGNPTLQSAYHILSDAQDIEMEKAGSIVNKPAFDEAKKQYQLASRALPMLKTAVAREAASKASLTVPGAALLTGHPMVAAGALMKPRLSQMASGAMFRAPEVLPANAGEMAARIPSVAGAETTIHKLPPTIDINNPALAQWRGMFEKNAASAKNDAEKQKAYAVTDFTLSSMDPNYAKAKQKMAEEKEKGVVHNQPIKMAEGGIVTTLKENLGKPVEGFGSTLEGLENVMKGTKAKPVPMEEKLPTKTNLKFHQPFNTDMEDKLKAFLLGEKDAERR